MHGLILSLSAVGGCLLGFSRAAPASSPNVERAIVSIAPLLNALNNIAPGTPPSSVLSEIRQVTPTASVTAATQALSKISSIYQASPTPNNIWAAAGDYVAAGLTGATAENAVDYLQSTLATSGGNNETNNNPRNPSPAAYPKAGPSDAPYDLSEATLRAAIYIPSTFKYGASGAPQPIVLVPGTGTTGYESYAGNYIPLLQGSSIGDPVWLNIPNQLLNDAQTNAEYVAYAVNYIYGISNQRNVSVLAWSQGNLDSQWAYKYWPSTRARITDHIAFSPDYHGTIFANFLLIPNEPFPPAIYQQKYDSNFVNTLRTNGGDSAYVPTTTIYSGFFDEIVEPQQGTNASAYLLDARNVGVTNNQVQTVCAGQPAGGFYTHEGILYNNLGFALAVDALQHDGPGRTSRLNLATVCALPLTQGLNLADFFITENSILIAGISILTYPTPTTVEPPIKSYART